MKLPNGFGSVYKLSGNRRNPWCARKTTGWNDKGHPVYKFVGYYKTRKDALTALAEFNKDPYDLHHDTITFQEVFDLWSAEHFPKVSESNIRGYNVSYKICADLYNMRMTDIKLDHLQKVADQSGKHTPTLKKLKNMLGLMWDYCVKHEILPPDKRQIVSYLDITKGGNPNKLDRTVFSREEINLLWSAVDQDSRYQIPLFLIYTGLRIGEMYNLKKCDISLSDHVFQVTEAKTQAGVREVPIADKIAEIVKFRIFSTESDYLFCDNEGKKFTDKFFRDHWWKPTMQDLQMSHLPHDTRHTCVSLLTEAHVDERIIKQIVGHKGIGVTQAVYTHLNRDVKLEAINRI